MIVAATEGELRDALDAYRTVRLDGLGTKTQFRAEVSAEATIRFSPHGIVEHFVDDQVVVVRVGTSLEALQSELAAKGQTLPFPASLGTMAAGFPGTVAGSIAMNLPHALEAQCGSWRDWVLGMTVMLADGTVFKCGSKAVKNVAGYDLQKLMIGARGTLGVLLEVTLRTLPLRALPSPEATILRDGVGEVWIRRVLRSDFERVVEAGSDRLWLVDPASSTVWSSSPLADGGAGWAIGPGRARIDDPVLARLMRRTKELFDPSGKLNPGEFDQ